MKKVMMYQADDGAVFPSEERAERHLAKCDLIDWLNKVDEQSNYEFLRGKVEPLYRFLMDNRKTIVRLLSRLED